LLYWYKSTNTDAAAVAQDAPIVSIKDRIVGKIDQITENLDGRIDSAKVCVCVCVCVRP
jgi:hypothetical protein